MKGITRYSYGCILDIWDGTIFDYNGEQTDIAKVHLNHEHMCKVLNDIDPSKNEVWVRNNTHLPNTSRLS